MCVAAKSDIFIAYLFTFTLNVSIVNAKPVRFPIM